MNVCAKEHPKLRDINLDYGAQISQFPSILEKMLDKKIKRKTKTNDAELDSCLMGSPTTRGVATPDT